MNSIYNLKMYSVKSPFSDQLQDRGSKEIHLRKIQELKIYGNF